MTKYLYNILEPLYSLTDIYILVNLFVRASRTHSTEKQKKNRSTSMQLIVFLLTNSQNTQYSYIKIGLLLL